LKKKTAEIFVTILFGSKIAIYLFLGHHKGRPNYTRSLQPSLPLKREHPALYPTLFKTQIKSVQNEVLARLN
jgi:hypothetical protein